VMLCGCRGVKAGIVQFFVYVDGRAGSR